MGTDKVFENRLRRMADRQGLTLTKSRRRDPRALDYGKYYLINQRTNTLVWHSDGCDLDDIEWYLSSS